jgi:CPA1 family monovalent cation:H+ antiporter
MEERLVLYLVGVPLLGVGAQWLAWRLRIPAILLLLGCGICLGFFVNPDEVLAQATGGERANGPRLLFPAVSLAVALILFEGGLSLRIHELQRGGGVVLRLVTAGAALSWVLTAFAAKVAFGLDLRIAVLVGAILVVTGPTVVGPLLRHIRPTRLAGSIAKWEGIVIDPIGAMLAILVFEQVLGADRTPSLTEGLLLLLKCVVVAAVIGYATATTMLAAMRHYLIPDFLQGAAFTVAALGAFAGSNAVQSESGLAAVTLLGVLLANQDRVPIRHIVEFNEHLGVLLVSSLFVVLGSRINLADVAALGWSGAAFVAALVLVIRPLSVFAATVGTGIELRERIFLAFLAPRGIVAAAVASVFSLKVATFAREESRLAQQAELLPLIVLVVVVGTVAAYGLLSAPLARWLGIADDNPQGLLIAGASRWIAEVARAVKDEGFAVLLVDTNHAHVRNARLAGLPAEETNILSEAVHRDLELSGVGRLLAMTPNAELNAMAVRDLVQLFGSSNVYQLAAGDQRRRRDGRLLFAQDQTYCELENRFESGAAIKRTLLTERFTWRHYQELYDRLATPLFILMDRSRLVICTPDTPIDPKPGHVVIALVDSAGTSLDRSATAAE